VEDRKARTVAAYQAHAAAYRDGTASNEKSGDVDGFARRLPAGAWVLEVGSGPGRDARALEALGLRVRRTDITPAFVELLRADGYDADVVDPLVDELGGPYDGVWASAVLLHLDRDEMPVVLARLRSATREGGLLCLSLKEGDGDGWSTHGHVSAPRHFTFWREGPLRTVLAGSGWSVVALDHRPGPRDAWLEAFAVAR